jgi:hypothetical protein
VQSGYLLAWQDAVAALHPAATTARLRLSSVALDGYRGANANFVRVCWESGGFFEADGVNKVVEIVKAPRAAGYRGSDFVHCGTERHCSG